MGKSDIFLLLLLGFIGGLFFYFYSSLSRATLIYFLGVITIFILIIISTLFVREDIEISRKRKILIFVFLAVVFSLGILRGITQKKIEIQEDFVQFEAEIYEEPKQTDFYSFYKVKSGEGLKALIKIKKYPEYQFGDMLLIQGFIKKSKPYQEVDGVLEFPGVEKISQAKLCFDGINCFSKLILEMAFSTKKIFSQSFNNLFPEPEVSFLKALLFGERINLPPFLKEALNITSTSHIVALSGYNISIIVAMLIGFLNFILIPRRFSFFIILLFVLLFVLAVGAQASVVRAAIMGSLLLFAQRIGRLYYSTNALVLAGFLMIFLEPRLLRFDLGFQLSFAATLGVIYLSPILLQKFQNFIPNSFIRNLFTVTLSAQIFVSPLLLYYFGNFSLIALLANMLVLPFIPFIMLGGFIASLIGLFSNTLGIVFGFSVFILLKYVLGAISFLAKMPLASIKLLSFHWSLVLICYALIILMIKILKKHPDY